MTDRILVHRIAVFAHHGVQPEEATLGQRFYISLACELDLATAGKTDDIARTANYAGLVEICVRIATQRRFALIEALAEAIAAEIMERYVSLTAVTVQVDKPGAAIPAVIDGVSVEIARSRAGPGLAR